MVEELTHNLRHVENDDGRLETDTETGNETTSDERTESVGGAGDDLDDATDEVDQAAENDSPLAADPVGEIASNDGTEEGTTGENGGDERVVGGAEGIHAGVDGLDEDGGRLDAVDVTGVVAEEDATEGGKGAHHVGLPVDGGLDELDVLGGVDGHAGVLLGSDLFVPVLHLGGRHCRGCFVSRQ
jgi:hypothetical protein